MSRSACVYDISVLGFQTCSYLLTMVTEGCLKKGTGGNKLTDLIIKHLFIYEKSNQTKTTALEVMMFMECAWHYHHQCAILDQEPG